MLLPRLPQLDRPRQVSRRDLASDPLVSLTYGAVFLVLAVSIAALPVLWPHAFPGARMWPLAGVALVASLSGLLLPPPRSAGIRNHLTVLSVPVVSAWAMLAFAPAGVAAVAGCMFAGIHTACRIPTRRALLAHATAGLLIMVAPLAVLPFDAATVYALLTGIPACVVIGLCTMLILSAAEEQSEELERLVRRDPLTGLGNPSWLHEVLAREIMGHTRTRGTFGVLTLDLDGLKAINVGLGREHGDAVLIGVATLLESLAGEGDSVFRQGGDEFTVVVPGCTRDDAEELAARIDAGLHTLAVPGNPPTAAIGVAVFPADARTPELLLDVAETRLALVKHATRTSWSRPALWSPEPLPATAAPPLDPEPRLDVTAGFTRLRRADIAESRVVWLATAASFAVFAGLLVFGLTVLTDDPPPAAIGFDVLLWSTAAVMLRTEAPAVGSVANHVVTAMPTLGAAATVVAAPQFAAAVVGVFAFAPTLAAIRLERRRAIGAHLLVTTVTLTALAASGTGPLPFSLAMLLLAVEVWVLGIWIGLHLEIAEREADELERLVRRDPSTGVGNRRLLIERLDEALPRHRRRRRSLTLVSVEVEEDPAGAGAADDGALRAVAELLTATMPAGATVARDGRRTFGVLLPATDGAAAEPILNALRVHAEGRRPAILVGAAGFPRDATEIDVLRRVAAWRRRDAGPMPAASTATLEAGGRDAAASAEAFTVIDGGAEQRSA